MRSAAVWLTPAMVEHLSGLAAVPANFFAEVALNAPTQKRPLRQAAVDALKEWGIDASQHASQPLTRELVDQAAVIAVMTDSHLDDVLRAFPDAEGRAHLLTAFGPGAPPHNIADPIGQSIHVYRTIRDQIDSAMRQPAI